MQVDRYIGYVLAIALMFLVLTAIKMVLPHTEPKKPVDVIGMELYKPIFFGTATDREVENTAIQSEEYQDDDYQPLEEKPVEEVAKKPLPKAITAKVTKPTASADDQAYFDQFIIDYKENVQAKRKYRNDVVVRYYRHLPDDTRADVLVGYGFYLHIRPVSNPEHDEKYGSNIIYYGKDFPERDIKLIAYLLLQNDIKIKEIRPFKDKDGWKHNSIEVGANIKIHQKPALTLSQIRNFKKVQ